MTSAEPWPPDARGRFVLPSGAVVVGRSRRAGRGAGGGAGSGAEPDFELVLAGRRERERPDRPHRLVAWPDFGLPTDRADAADAFAEALARSRAERVAVSCGGGRGRTGTALACLAVLDGADPAEAVALVRRGYDRRAVETPWQARYVRRFGGAAGRMGA